MPAMTPAAAMPVRTRKPDNRTVGRNMRGKIIKAIAGFYYIHDGHDIYACRARGVFRNIDTKPLAGDDVTFEVTDTKDMEGWVTSVLERRNELNRPPVANADQMLAFFAVKDPDPSVLHISRLLIAAERAGIPQIIVFNKADLAEADASPEDALRKLQDIFRGTDIGVHLISVRGGSGIEDLKQILAGRTTVLSGPSGAGKSSFVNALLGERKMETGEISRKLQRGKQTTRHTELMYLPELGEGSYIFDTPGFSALDNELEPEDVQNYFPEIAAHIPECRFSGCAHINEPDCGVKQALAEGLISPERYEAYRTLYAERKAAARY
mgnify:CR=1 FL=1